MAGWKIVAGTAIAAAAMTLAAPASADTKAGVDAWQHGDYRTAVAVWRPLAVAGDADAQFNMGQAYKLGKGVPVDMALAEQWYRKAALQGHLLAEDNYGLALFMNGKRTEAVRWLERSSARGEPRTQYVLGAMLFNGDGVEKDWVRAYALMVRSSAAGLAQGSQTLAQMDRYIPADQRQQGLTLSRQMEADAQHPQLAQAAAPTPRASEPMRQASLPPSAAAEGDLPEAAAPRPAPRRTLHAMPATPMAQQQPDAAPPPQPYPAAAAALAPPQTRVATAPMRAMPRATAQGRWRVQLGAFRDRSNADQLWRKLSTRVDAFAGLQPTMTPSGALTKLQVGPFATSAEASRACEQVKPTGTPCVVVGS